MGNTIKFTAIRAKQSKKHTVLSFAATASDVKKIAEIDRIGRKDDGSLVGFQRSQVSNHIHEIRDYLKQDEAVLPNPIVVAFTNYATVKEVSGNIVELIVDISKGAPGLVVDGQQRLTALSALDGKDFEVFVSGLICKDEAELRKQFVLINNTKPLPKSLIYELLPTVDGLPARLASRSMASKFVESLNFDETSSLHGLIKLHTHPDGVIADSSIQKVVMNSLNDGACRELMHEDDGYAKAVNLISDFYAAVQEVFPEAWHGQTPKSSRLMHGAGIVAMGYVMEYLFFRNGASTKAAFMDGIKSLDGNTAWTTGVWEFGPAEEDRWKWNAIQNIGTHIQMLSAYMLQVLKHGNNPYARQPKLGM